MEELANNLDRVLGRIEAAAREAGRDPAEVTLVAVSKTHPAEAVRVAFNAGQRIFGESRVQELLSKVPDVPGGVEWHFIGHLQKNKIRKVLGVVGLIHGVDSLELARDIDRIAAEEGVFPRVLLEVNLADEATKFGFRADALARDLDDLLALPRLEIEGLMGMAPVCPSPDEARPYFAGLRDLRDRLAAQSGVPLTTLSMGMSGDFEPAIREGATLVRVGTAIFGSRAKD